MRSLLTTSMVIVLLQTHVCPQDIKSYPKLPANYPYFPIGEEQLMPPAKGADGRMPYKSMNDFIAGKLKKNKSATESGGNIFMPDMVIIDSTKKFIYTWREDGSQKIEVYQELKDGAWNNVSRRTYVTANGRQISFVNEQWENGAWVNYERINETYQDNYTRSVAISESWRENHWVPYSRHTFSYDRIGNLLSDIWEEIENGIWTNVSRYTYIYDDCGKLLISLDERWKNGAWINNGKYTSTYKNEGKLLTNQFQVWHNDLWINIYRATSTYDINGNELSSLWEDWRKEDWLKSYMYTRTFDNKNRLLTELLQDWNNGAWVNSSRSINIYSASSDTVKSLGQAWIQDAWVPSSRATRTYNSSGFLLTDFSENFIDTVWVNNFMQRFHYDYSGNTDQGESFIWKNGAWRPLYRLQEFKFNNGRDRTYYYGSSVQVAYSVFLDEGPSVAQEINLEQNFPNPFNSTTTFFFSIRKTAPVRISVYDILGNRVAVLLDEITPPGYHQVDFDGRRFSSGVYIYRLESGGFNIAKKFILMK